MNLTDVEGSWDELKSNWLEIKGKLKQKYATLTEDDLLWAEGKQEELLGNLQFKLSKTREELHKLISGL